MADRESEAHRIFREWRDGGGPTWNDRKAAESPGRYAVALGVVVALLSSPLAIWALVTGRPVLGIVLGLLAASAGVLMGRLARRHARIVAIAMELWEEHDEKRGPPPPDPDQRI